MKTVPRVGRILDLVGLLLFVAGGVLFLRSWIGFRGVQDYVAPADAALWSAVAVADEYWLLQKVGVGIMIAGVAVFVVAWWVARSAARRPSVAESDSPLA